MYTHEKKLFLCKTKGTRKWLDFDDQRRRRDRQTERKREREGGREKQRGEGERISIVIRQQITVEDFGGVSYYLLDFVLGTETNQRHMTFVAPLESND